MTWVLIVAVAIVFRDMGNVSVVCCSGPSKLLHNPKAIHILVQNCMNPNCFVTVNGSLG